MLKTASSVVLASFGPSTYGNEYASAPHSLRPCQKTVLNMLFKDCMPEHAD